MIIELPNQKLYLKPNESFGKPYQSPKAGFGYVDRSRILGGWVVNAIYKDSDASHAGLRTNDLITKINGRMIQDIGLREQDTL
jgi:C-terminal processing protease CtpA/Prc